LRSILVETERSLAASKKLGTLCALLQEEEKMKSKVSQFALAAVLAAGFAAPALAQNTNWKLNSDHSAGRISIGSTADPNTILEAGIARVKGSVRLDAGSLTNSSFDFTIYPADDGPASINEDGSVNAAEFSNVARSTVINFRSKEVKLTGDGDLAVTGDLTLSHLERPFLITYSEAYGRPVYGEPEVRSATREVTFVFQNVAAAEAKAGSSRKLKLAASAGIKTEDFPGLFEAVTNANWPVVLENKVCQEPATIGEEYHGMGCTGTPVVISSRPSPWVTVVEDYPGPDLATPRVRDNVKIALTLELNRSASAAAEVAGN
jgi:polyisoprenoid-binding protein YceI